MPKQTARDTRMTIGEHLEELRRRVIFALLGIAVAATIMLIVGRNFVAILIDPLLKVQRENDLPAQVIFVNLTDAFTVYLKISLVAGLIVASPWVLYQGWKFISVGMYTSEKKVVLVLLPFAGVMALLGVLFMYFAMLPICLWFFIAFGLSYPQSMVKPMIAIREYINFVTMLAVGIVVAFQLPVVMMTLGWTKIVDPRWLVRYRPHCIFACFTLGMLLTPVDVVSMIVLAVPLWALFELGMVLMRIVYGKSDAGASAPGSASGGG